MDSHQGNPQISFSDLSDEDIKYLMASDNSRIERLQNQINTPSNNDVQTFKIKMK